MRKEGDWDWDLEISTDDHGQSVTEHIFQL